MNKPIFRNAPRMFRGFTLTELVMVITLTLLLSATAIGGLIGMKSWRAAAAVRRVNEEILYARNLAVLTGRRTLWACDLANQTYEIRQEAAARGGALDAQPLPHPLTGAAWNVALAELAAGLSISAMDGGDNGRIGFDTAGVPSGAAGNALKDNVQVKFTNQMRITVFSGSGLCEIERP